MTRFTKSANGKYMIQGKSYEVLIGSRAQVWHGTAYKTNGELKKAIWLKIKLEESYLKVNIIVPKERIV